MSESLLVLTEGSPEIGLGHLVECQAIVDSWCDHGLKEYLFLVHGDVCAKKFLESKKITFKMVGSNHTPSSSFIKEYDAVLVNKKYVEYELLKSLKQVKSKLIVIDELGGIKITADILVNFSVNTKRHNYIFPDKEPRKFFGAEYFPAGRAVFEALKIPRPKSSSTVVVSMGGYDNSNITLRVIEVLKQYKHLRKEIILGPGFSIDYEFKNLTGDLDETFEFYENVNDLPKRIREARFLINSGGNTLYEAAILGAPVLVIGEDPHEIEQGDIFESMGYAVNIKEGKRATFSAMQKGIKALSKNIWKNSKFIKPVDWHDFVFKD